MRTAGPASCKDTQEQDNPRFPLAPESRSLLLPGPGSGVVFKP